ncbi:phage antirepressor KilAC domain-containing protein [Bifidobacterium cuniculi]|uniref:Phage antirepressor protein n=1 Tax=Bifidobacterium cuniculi TaxID=1688 RepID=A0A087B4Y0_9BIFI|nr:phage antirepressor KilAC domain-containing protein [Bifidobacterium cuniculi]KFI66080.1 phage antirepressor protein [Bifidobacterium cuniculi]
MIDNTTSVALTPFDFHGSQVRVFTDDQDAVWFVAKDVCDVLGTATNHVREYLDDDEVSNLRITDIAQSGGRAPVIISEAGFYKLVLRSRKPVAKEFQRWVTHEVLPSIRKHGGYMAGQEAMSPEQMVAASMRWLESRIAEQKAQLEAQAPKVVFADAIITSDTNILVRRLANILRQNGVNIGQNRLFKWLRANGYLTRTNDPTQRALDLGLFVTRTNKPYTDHDGNKHVTYTTLVTPRGQVYFVNKFLAD